MPSVAARPLSPALRPFVRALHFHQTDFPFSLERIVPSGQAHLMINLAEDQFRTYPSASLTDVRTHPGAVLAGPHAQATILDTQEMLWLTAVQFHPGAAAPFFSVPMSEARDQVVGLDRLWSSGGRTLRERLLEAPTPRGKFAVLEDALLGHLHFARDPMIPWAMNALEQGIPVATVTARLGLLPKTFVRRFTSAVGITPRRFARVRRLQRVLRAARNARSIDWCALAARCGYADQSHLVHECRDLVGIPPSACKPHSPERSNHIPIPLP
jgi:AraC-like DNA-binding protein